MLIGDALPPLPSLFTPVLLPQGEDALARAVALAPSEGAGTLVWMPGALHTEAALVLEPDRPLGPALVAYLAAANALADALSAIVPPELPVTWRWPGTLMVNGGEVGGIRLALPEHTALDAIPDWLVLGFGLRFAWPEGTITGERPGETALLEEGFEELTPGELVASWARHFMANMDEWQARGVRRVSDKYLARLGDFSGEKRGIDPGTAALVVEREGARETWPIL